MTRRALFVFTVAALAACRARPSRDECMKMLDRYIDMTLGQDPRLVGLPDEQAAEAREILRAAKQHDPVYDRRREQCVAEVTRAQFECAMKAPTANDWEACIE